MTRRAILVCAVLVVPASAPAQTSRELFPNTDDLGRAVIKYADDTIQVVAAYNYSQQNHDSRWLLIEIGVTTSDVARIKNGDITLVMPDGRSVAVASQRAFAQDVQRTRLLVQNARPTRHLAGRTSGYFRGRRSARFQWFVVTPFEGIVTDFFDVDVHRTAWGDLYFASPTGAWEETPWSCRARTRYVQCSRSTSTDVDETRHAGSQNRRHAVV